MGETSKSIRSYQFEDLVINVPEEDFEITSDCCIYEVPKSIRQAKEEAYTPKLISIGPFHYGNEKLAEMEKQKLRYLKKFCERTSMDTLENLLRFIKEQGRGIRNCYAKSFSNPEFESSEFIKMILCDAIFIIELFLRDYEKKDDFLVNRSWVYRYLEVDLVLLENQLPFFVLDGLYKLAPLPSDYPTFLKLACKYLNINFDSSLEEVKIKHFTDLIRWKLVPDRPSSCPIGIWMNDLCSATMLHEAGVKFKSKRIGSLGINFEKNKLLISPLHVHPYTESRIRNVIALEQCHYPDNAHVCAYFDLMDHLINTEKDVELLVKEKVLINSVGSDAAVAGIINNLLEGVYTISDCYDDIVKNLMKYHRSPWNREIATLKQVYFNNRLRGTLSVAAFLVVLFTFMQTFVAILERVKPTK